MSDVTPEMVQQHLAQANEGSVVDTIPNATGRFGYDPTNPIPVHLPEGEYMYLVSLECPCRRPFMFHRVGSMDPGPDGHLIDKFELICRRHTCHLILYLDMYHPGPSTLLPEGLRRTVPKGQGVLTRVEPFPDGLQEAIAIALRKQRAKQIRTS
jgi:hypothetical protein